ncbi:MAG: Na+/H+ antiporter subunit E [Gaiellaceae bacterium]
MSFVGWWAALFLVWLGFAGTVERTELAVGAGASLVAAALAELVRRQGVLRYEFPARSAAGLWRLPWALVRDFGVLLLVLLRGERRPGAFRAFRAELGGPGDRALAIVGETISPNTIAVDLDPETGIALMHDLDPVRASQEIL